jgi:hypothetical protein
MYQFIKFQYCYPSVKSNIPLVGVAGDRGTGDRGTGDRGTGDRGTGNRCYLATNKPTTNIELIIGVGLYT